MTSSTPGPRGRGRPRDRDADERILDAALEEYGEQGWAGFTMDAVAKRAGVGKSTVYLRWQDKDSLLTDAVTARSRGIALVDTGSLRGDLEAMGANLLRHLLDPVGWANLRIAVDAAGSPVPLGRFTEAVSGRHREDAAAVVRRAIDRGEAPADLPVVPLVECLYGAITVQALSLAGENRRLTDEQVAERVRTLVDFLLGTIEGP